MGDVQHELDHSGKMLARLAEEFRKPRISAILTGEAAQYQAIEDAFWQLLVERGVDTAVGNALDVLGRWHRGSVTWVGADHVEVVAQGGVDAPAIASTPVVLPCAAVEAWRL